MSDFHDTSSMIKNTWSGIFALVFSVFVQLNVYISYRCYIWGAKYMVSATVEALNALVSNLDKKQ